ncbi:MAG TPA: GNAT family N-acetyltransferase [Clostridium sp.]|uniref:GNAT family N-acetyltransferase n=1 Tax=Clostridium sp. TaxID=1506 RepID=UPI002F9238A4
MKLYSNKEKNIDIYTLDITRWKDFETLFGERGACGGCWCMSWRLRKSEFEKQKGTMNKEAMKRLVEQNESIGVLAYIGRDVIGWCAVAPREVYLRLEKSRVLKRIDDEPVWSISCLFITKAYRRKGISALLIKGAINYCKTNGATIIEAYPVVPYSSKVPDAFMWKGMPTTFEKVGFVVAERRSNSKPIMRYYL